MWGVAPAWAHCRGDGGGRGEVVLVDVVGGGGTVVQGGEVGRGGEVVEVAEATDSGG